MGQIAVWNFKTEVYERNPKIYDFVSSHLKMHNGMNDKGSQVEQVAQYIFR